MYADPRHVRDNPIKVRLNDDQKDLIYALAKINGRQPAAFALELLMLGVKALEQGTDHAQAA